MGNDLFAGVRDTKEYKAERLRLERYRRYGPWYRPPWRFWRWRRLRRVARGMVKLSCELAAMRRLWRGWL